MSIITIFTSLTYPINSGAGINAYNFAKALSEKKYFVRLVSLNNEKRVKEVIKINNNFEIIKLPIKTHGKIQKRIVIPKAIFFYRKLLKESDINFIYGVLPGFFYLIYKSFKTNKVSIFRSTMLNDDDVESIINKYGTLIGVYRKYMISKISYYFSINREFSRRYKRIFPTKTNIIETPQGVDGNKFFPVDNNEKKRLRRKYNLPEEKKIILSVGYLIRRKGYQEIFDVLSKINQDFLYIIIGDHPYTNSNYLKEVGAGILEESQFLYDYGKAKLKDKLKYLGIVQNYIDEYFKLSDIFILNSDQEGTPNVLLEAMACGNIILVKKLDGLVNFLLFNQQNCLIHFNFKELTDNLQSVVDDSLLPHKLKNNASSFIQEHFTFDKIIKKKFLPILYNMDI